MKKRIYFFICLLFIIGLSGCNNSKNSISKEYWGTYKNKKIYLYTITNSKGAIAKITNYGATLTSLCMPDRDGKLGDVVLGYDSLTPYIERSFCFGGTIGRVANRIKDAKFNIDSKEYFLTADGDGNINHSNRDFNTAVWRVEKINQKGNLGLKMTYLSLDGKDGFPGNVNTSVKYILRNDNALEIRFSAQTDKATYINMTHHSYFNLSASEDKIFDDSLYLNSDRYLNIDDEIVPNGGYILTKGTPEDLSSPVRLGDKMSLMDMKGYHYCYVFNKPLGSFEKVGELYNDKSGRVMTISTSQIGVQVYSCQTMPDSIKGKGGKIYGKYSAICLETEYFPNSPNISSFPSTLLRPGEVYNEKVVYSFSTRK